MFPVLWHSNAPWLPSGYGQQSAIFGVALQSMGLDVAFSCNAGLNGAPLNWGNMPVFPAANSMQESVVRTRGQALTHFNERDGVVLGLFDSWAMPYEAWEVHPHSVLWSPVDTDRLGKGDYEFAKKSGTKVLAMSKHAQKCYADRDIDSTYVPHAVATSIFNPDGPDNREHLGIPEDAFVVGINAANRDNSNRKALPQQFMAFAAFAKKHSDAVLSLHMQELNSEGFDIREIAEGCGVDPKKIFTPNQFAYTSGLISPQHVAQFYRSCNVLSNATMGEGFGIPTLEAQACGVPVVVSDNSASREMCGAGWKVDGDPFYVHRHEANWTIPSIKAITIAYERAYLKAANMKQTAVSFAKKYELAHVAETMMLPALQEALKS